MLRVNRTALGGALLGLLMLGHAESVAVSTSCWLRQVEGQLSSEHTPSISQPQAHAYGRHALLQCRRMLMRASITAAT